MKQLKKAKSADEKRAKANERMLDQLRGNIRMLESRIDEMQRVNENTIANSVTEHDEAQPDMGNTRSTVTNSVTEHDEVQPDMGNARSTVTNSVTELDEALEEQRDDMEVASGTSRQADGAAGNQFLEANDGENSLQVAAEDNQNIPTTPRQTGDCLSLY